LGIGLATRLLFPNMKGMSLEITEELIARQTAGSAVDQTPNALATRVDTSGGEGPVPQS
jgi:hypothetical protein